MSSAGRNAVAPPPSGTASALETSVTKAAGIVALGNISSRILGLVRVTLIATLFGATGLVSAYQIAAIVPTMVYDLLVGGMLSSALVPVFSEYAASKGREELGRLVGAVLTLGILFISVVVLGIEVFAPTLAWLLGGGFSPELLAVTTRAIRIVAIALLFLSLSGIVTGVLYALKRFTYPAFGAAAFNVGIIAAALLLSHRLGIYSLVVGIVLGSLIQLGIQVPELRRTGIGLHLRLDPSHPGLRRLVRLYLPVMLGLLISQIQIAIDRNLATRTGEQSIAWMQNATTLIQFPHGLVAVAISLAVLPSLSQFHALGDPAGYRRTLSLGLRLVIILTVPAAVGLFVLARPAVAAIFEHGRFTPADTYWTSLALKYYVLGLIFAAIDWPLNYAFYARQDTVTPALVGVLSVGVYLAAALSLMPSYGMIGLVLADSIKHCSHALTMLLLTYKKLGGLENRRLLSTLLTSAFLSGAMALVILAVLRWWPSVGGPGAFLSEVVLLGTAGGLGLVTYFGLGTILGQEDLLILWGRFRVRLRPKAVQRP